MSGKAGAAEEDDDELVPRLAVLLDDPAALGAALQGVVRRYGPLAKKAAWSARQTGLVNGLDGPALEFETEWLLGNCRYYVCAARSYAGDCVVCDLPDSSPAVYLTWHHPSYPLLLPQAAQHDGIMLLAQQSAWMARVLGDECCVYFRSRTGTTAIKNAFASGRSVFAMFDYCYDETRSFSATFLGRPCRTPAGLLVYAQRFGYPIRVISWRSRHDPVVVAEVDSAVPDPGQLAAEVNAALSAEIVRSPADWLMWPSLDRRWVLEEMPVPTSKAYQRTGG